MIEVLIKSYKTLKFKFIIIVFLGYLLNLSVYSISTQQNIFKLSIIEYLISLITFLLFLIIFNYLLYRNNYNYRSNIEYLLNLNTFKLSFNNYEYEFIKHKAKEYHLSVNELIHRATTKGLIFHYFYENDYKTFQKSNNKNRPKHIILKLDNNDVYRITKIFSYINRYEIEDVILWFIQNYKEE